jgi:hypothetical protein
MDTTYRAEKDGLSFYIQPFMLESYAEQGYDIYKTVEVEVTDIAAEQQQATQAVEQQGVVEGEEVANG